jgi:hypothetical protein
MKSSKYLSNGPWYSLLALFMPLSILAVAASLLNVLLSADLPLALIITNGCVSAFAASFYSDFMKDTRANRTAANIRGGIIIMIVLYLFASLFSQELSWEERYTGSWRCAFQPDTPNVLSSIAALYAWVSVIRLKLLFSACKLFDGYTEKYSGEKLQGIIFYESSLLYFTDEKIIKVIQNYFLKFFIIAILAIICVANNIPLPAALYVLLIVILVGGVCTFGFFGIIKIEHYYAGEGLGLPAKDRSKRIAAMFLFSLFCLVLAIFPASNKSLLPFSLVTGFFYWFFDWLYSLFRRPAQGGDEFFIEEDIIGEADWVVSPEPPTFEEFLPSPLWEAIIRFITLIIKYGFFILVAAGFIRYMVAPLINRGNTSGKMNFFQRLWLIILEWFKGIIFAIFDFFENLKYDKNILKLNKDKTKEINRAAKNIFGAYSSAKKRNMRQSINLFARLIIWGGQARNVTWRPSLAPGEYCSLLATAELESPFNAKIMRCGELFEKAIYSKDFLTSFEHREFKSSVKEITAS